MDIVHLVKTIRVVLACGAFGATMVSDSAVRREQVLISYIGASQPESDASYARFLDALKKSRQPLPPDVNIQYVTGPADDQAALAAAVSLALKDRPSLLVTPTGDATVWASRTAKGTPIVFASYVDLVRAGVVGSLSSPGGHTTGVSLADRLVGKRLEILHEAAPQVRSVAIIADRSWAVEFDGVQEAMLAAKNNSLTATFLYAESEDELDAIMEAADAVGYDAWYFPPTYISYIARNRIIRHICRLQKLAIFSSTAEVLAGGMMAYEQDTSFVWDTMADLVARVLSGEDAGTIPVERPRRYILSVRTGPVCGASPIAPSVTRRADLVVQDSSPHP